MWILLLYEGIFTSFFQLVEKIIFWHHVDEYENGCLKYLDSFLQIQNLNW
jgi:hypothetical protein